jgi:hypothetical protein
LSLGGKSLQGEKAALVMNSGGRAQKAAFAHVSKVNHSLPSNDVKNRPLKMVTHCTTLAAGVAK